MNLSGRRGRLPCLLRWPPRHDWEKTDVISLERLDAPRAGDVVIETVRCKRCGRQKIR
jgi:hypothetical protein